MTTNQASGGVRRAPTRAHGRRHRAAETRVSVPLRAVTSSSAGVANAQPVTSVVHACCHWEKSTQSVLPFPQSAMGVFHSEILLKYEIGAFAWYCVQDPACMRSMNAHALLLSGVSPYVTACCAWTFGVEMYCIHR